jgi:DNA segregation ATPase FtsK/SpoIIIE, S-DNA-T family
LKDTLPHPVTNITWRELAAMYGELAAELKRRQEATSDDLAPIYIFIFDVQRFRDIRKSDDDFGYARYDEDKPMPPSKLFADVLRDGPPVGIHTIIWCDSVNNMNRTLDRQGMKEFENRILFQMSANDSSTLIETPAASKLGENRALYYSEEENRIEKFRPYGIPELEWLENVKRRFAARPRPEVNGHADGGGTGAAAPLVESHAPNTAMAEPPDVNGHRDGDGNGTAPPAESHSPRVPTVDDVIEPSVEAL